MKTSLKLSKASNIHEIWSESAAESVYVERKPTHAEVTQIWNECWPDTPIRPRVFRLKPFYVEAK